MQNRIAFFILLLTANICWSQPGNTGFNAQDRLAIKNLINAYAVHWDSGNVDEYFLLFTDDALSLSYVAGQPVTSKLKKESAIESAKQRVAFFKKNKMQRRHIMSSTFFLRQTSHEAEAIQYCLLITTDTNSPKERSNINPSENSIQSRIVSPIVYHFVFTKENGVWKIRSREMKLDKPLDVPLDVPKNR